ncbi:EamA domain-containing membrane protein RarD [Variovorax sp. HW608]|uniref:DMT family transporter n=1 Tax=Variovorax sp. HW608 TaxID=1034889 RepID=UPI00081F9925|nr:DMT family transporter [Variovorax sp. HW608]SCK23435.1 EamA domain-containing membrane protein RarD [Variovorax sp. HW608]
MSAHRSGLTVAHIAALLFGLTGVLGALIRGDAAVVTLGRACFACAALATFALVHKLPLVRTLTLHKLRILFATGALLAIHWVTFFVAVKVGGVAVATLGFASFPAFIAMLDMLLFREKICPSEGLLLTLVTMGLVLVTPSFDFGDQGTVGLMLGLGSGLSFAILAMCNRRGVRGMNPVQIAFWQNAVVSLLVAPIAASGLGRLGPMDWFFLALLGIFCTGLSQYLFVKSLETLSARTSGMVLALEPVYAIACAWWLFAERPSLRMLAGAALIISATAMSARKGPQIAT